MLHPKYKRQTDYCCCTGTIHCRYCTGQGKPPHLTVDKDYNTVSIVSKAYMGERLEKLSDMAREYRNLQAKEPVNELTNITMDHTLKTQAQFTISVKSNNFIVGSVSTDGTLSFSINPMQHVTAGAARAECARLARINPGRLYIFVQLAGGELVPIMSTLSI